jgi:hypothetical protein
MAALSAASGRVRARDRSRSSDARSPYQRKLSTGARLVGSPSPRQRAAEAGTGASRRYGPRPKSSVEPRASSPGSRWSGPTQSKIADPGQRLDENRVTLARDQVRDAEQLSNRPRRGRRCWFGFAVPLGRWRSGRGRCRSALGVLAPIPRDASSTRASREGHSVVGARQWNFMPNLIENALFCLLPIV